jgi:hypothetical protein
MSDAFHEPGPTTSTASDRRWMWHANLASRAAGKVSVLACVETAIAVALYWWVAIRFDTHWHLLTSVFIAPLLLLRSPESIAAGLRWFTKDWFAVGRAESWAVAKKVGWFIFFAIVSALITRPVALQFSHHFLPGLESWALMGAAAAIGLISSLTGWVVGFAIWGAVSPSIGRSFSVVTTITLWNRIIPVYSGILSVLISVLVVSNVASKMAGTSSGQVSIAIVSAVSSITAAAGVCIGGIAAALLTTTAPAVRVFGGLGVGVGLSLRAGLIRAAATTWYATAGGKRIAENWRENNFHIDSTVPAELMPAIGTFDGSLALGGFSKAMRAETDPSAKWTLFPALGAFLFLPAFFYRLNIKATCWFYWPLAFMLKPVPQMNEEGEQREALCSPWTDPWQLLCVVLSLGPILISLVVASVDYSALLAMEGIPAVPLVWKVLLALEWTHLAPWHVMQWIIAATTVGMLYFAGPARSHAINNNWAALRPRVPRLILVITVLRRLRALATIALMLMGFGALALEERGWQRYVPARWVEAMEDFYNRKTEWRTRKASRDVTTDLYQP